VPTYQHVGFIGQCLDSLLMQQTSFRYEIIIGEDESTDGTREICIDYAREYPDRIRLFLRSRTQSTWVRNGETRLRNGVWCIQSARANYVASCEGDDYWTTPHKLQRQVDLLESHPEWSMCFGAHLDFVNGQIGGDELFPPGRKPFYSMADILTENFIGTCTAVWRRSAIVNLEEWMANLPIGDWTAHILSATKGRIGYVDAVLGARRRHLGGIWSSLSKAEHYRGEIRFLTSIRRRVGAEFAKVIDEGIARRYHSIGDEMLRKGQRLAALRSYGRCLMSPGARALGRRTVIGASLACLRPRSPG
jgi:glycosyltransferase involved in cell wall biosynthesis